MPHDSPISREAFELLREAYSETEVWKIAQLAVKMAPYTIEGRAIYPGTPEADREQVRRARALLAEARRQVAANPGAA